MTAAAAGGTHPTGIHSCFICIFTIASGTQCNGVSTVQEKLFFSGLSDIDYI